MRIHLDFERKTDRSVQMQWKPTVAISGEGNAEYKRRLEGCCCLYNGSEELFCSCCGGLSILFLHFQPRTQPERKECMQRARVSISAEESGIHTGCFIRLLLVCASLSPVHRNRNSSQKTTFSSSSHPLSSCSCAWIKKWVLKLRFQLFWWGLMFE